MKQTAVEWLIDELSLKSKALKIMLNAHKEIVEQAKEIEKEQIQDAFDKGKWDSLAFKGTPKEQYYNETFKK